jgi:tetratricopeptide (TPR) repeat protein
MTGSVQLDRNRRRVNAQLIDVASGDEIWSDRYDSDARADDIFAVQDSITHAIVESLRLPLSAVETAMLEQRSTTDREAHDLYLQGRYFFEKRDQASLAKARDFFERAITRDSLYARAYAGLSDAYSHSSVFGYATPAAVHAKAKAAALRALALDSVLVEGHVARGFVALFLEFDFATAERALARAVQLDPRYAPGHQFRAWHLISAGRANEAVEEMREALRLDPFSLVINARLTTMLTYARRFEEALVQAQRTLDLDSMFFSGRGEYARALLALGRCAEAVAFIEKDSMALSTAFRGLRGVAHASCDNRNNALAELDFLRAEAARGKYVTRYAFAAIHAALGNRDQALAELDAAVDERAWALFTLLVEPDFDAMRSDARFTRLLGRIGLRS